MRYVIIMLGIAIIFSGCVNKDRDRLSEVEDEDIVPVKIVKPTYGEIEKKLFFTGTAEGIDDAYVFPDLPGRFMQYLKPEGSFVKKGEPIVLLEREMPGVEFKPVRVNSPIDGYLSYMMLSVGQAVLPQTPVARIAKLDKIKVRFTVPEKYAKNVKKGVEVLLEDPLSSGKFIKGTVDWVSTFLDPISHTLDAQASFVNKDKAIMPGMFLRLQLIVERASNVLVVPFSAVVYNDTSYVFLAKGGRAKKHPVLVGLTDWNYCEIKMGLTPDDSVIVVGLGVVEDGSKIRLLQEDKK